MSEVMTKAEIEAQFVGEWILIEDPETSDEHEVLRGRVVCHSKDRGVIDREMLSKRLKHSAVLYTGTIPPGMAIVL